MAPENPHSLCWILSRLKPELLKNEKNDMTIWLSNDLVLVILVLQKKQKNIQ